MSNPPDMLGLYARSLNEAMRYEQKNKPVPQHIMARIQQIEQIAQVQLNPAQIQNAMEHVSRIRLEDTESFNQTNDFVNNKFDQVKENRAFKSASSGMSPSGLDISPEQISEAKNNDGKYTVHQPKTIDIDGLNKYTKKKFGVDLDTFEERHDNLLNVKLKGDDIRTESLRKSYGISEDEMNAYEKTGFKFLWARRQQENDSGEPESYTEQMSESAQRKADIMIAASSDHGERVYDDEIDESYMENENLQGDVARAYAEVEQESIISEVQQELGANNG